MIDIFRPSNLSSIMTLIGARAAKHLFISFICGLTIGLVEYFIAMLLQVFFFSIGLIDEKIISKKLIFFTELNPSIIFTLVLLTGALRFSASYGLSRSNLLFSELISLRLRLLTNFQILKTDQLQSSSAVHARISDTFPKTAAFLMSFARLISQTVVCTTILISMFTILPGETIASTALVIILGLWLLRINKQVQRECANLPKLWFNLVDNVEVLTKNKFYIRATGSTEREYANINSKTFDYSRIGLKTRGAVELMNNLPQIYGLLMVAVVIILSRTYFNSEPADLLSFLYMLLRFSQGLTPLSSYLGGCALNLPQFNISTDLMNQTPKQHLAEINSIYKHWPELPNANESDRNEKNASPSPPEIEFSNIAVQHGEDSPTLLQNVNLTIDAGKAIGVVGRSGIGKSTLLSIVLGFHRPKSGKVLFNGKQSPDEFLKDFAIRTAYVGPEPYLIRGTLRENLLYCNQLDISESDISKALKFCGLSELLDESGNCVHYELGPKPALSTGQAQRLAFARAILRQPRLLLLDEPTANIDAETEKIISRNLEALKGKCTILVISHKVEFLSFTDKIFKIENQNLHEQKTALSS